VGGKSMPGVNEGISAAVQLTFDALGSRTCSTVLRVVLLDTLSEADL
jgi:hypothetical protein